MQTDRLTRFREPHDRFFGAALRELEEGRKRTHWMWFIFPQLGGLGSSEMARRYAIQDLEEAALFLQDDVLGSRLVRICRVLEGIRGRNAREIFGTPDDLKLRSSMTLFSLVPGADPVFDAILERYYDGKKDPLTLDLLKKKSR